MKSVRILLILLTICLPIISCSRGITKLTNPGSIVRVSADDQMLPVALREKYWIDASVLTARKINREGGPHNHSIELPQSEIQVCYDTLVRVYNAKRLVARDEVVDVYEIHAREFPKVYKCMIAVADTTSWAIGWAQGNSSTGNVIIDSLAEKYGLSTKTPLPISGNQYFGALVADRPINIAALIPILLSIPGVIDAWTSPPGGLPWPQDDIKAIVMSDKVEMEFIHGGPGTNISWRFRIYAIGLVEFLEKDITPP